MDHLDADFKETLKLIQKLRKVVSEEPLVDNASGTYPNPAARLMASEQLHLRGLARLIGPSHVDREIGTEFNASSALARDLTLMVAEDSESPVAPILRDTQTHIRGCAAILANAKSAPPPDSKDKEFEDLFLEPGQSTILGDSRVTTGTVASVNAA